MKSERGDCGTMFAAGLLIVFLAIVFFFVASILLISCDAGVTTGFLCDLVSVLGGM